MIDVKQLDKNLEQYKQSLKHRGAAPDVLNQLLDLNQKRKESILESETEKAEQNKLSAQIPQMKKQGQDASALLAELGKRSARVKELEAKTTKIEDEVTQLALTLPNKLHESVPVGTSAEQNKEMKKVGEPVKFGFKAKEHWEIGEKLGILDFERAAKVTGARFTFLKGGAARLERAISQFFMDLHSTKHGYTEMIPPYMANSASFVGTGQFPKFTEDVFSVKGTDYFLVPTAEVPVTNYYRDEILDESQLPQSFCAFSPCFRSEAGSAGRDTTGLIRQHQFHKVELMTFCHPEKSYEVHEQLTSHAEQCLIELELPFRRMLLCTGDMSANSAKTYDLEAWMPGAQTYREISSCSNFEDFQARRANIRFKSKGGKPQFVHTLNGSGLAVGRTLIAILENYQQEDGTIKVPKALVKYMNGMEVIKG